MVNFEFNEHTICKYTEEELREASFLITKELEERTYKKKEELIEAFENAWKDLEKFGVYIYYDETIDGDQALNFNSIYFN